MIMHLSSICLFAFFCLIGCGKNAASSKINAESALVDIQNMGFGKRMTFSPFGLATEFPDVLRAETDHFQSFRSGVMQYEGEPPLGCIVFGPYFSFAKAGNYSFSMNLEMNVGSHNGGCHCEHRDLFNNCDKSNCRSTPGEVTLDVVQRDASNNVVPVTSAKKLSGVQKGRVYFESRELTGVRDLEMRVCNVTNSDRFSFKTFDEQLVVTWNP